MMIRNLKLTVGLGLALLFPVPFVRAQQSSIDDLKKEIQTLGQTIKEMQKDLQDIKTLLQARVQAPAPPRQNVLLDLAGHPTHGESTAKLTLVEFTDYQ